MVCGLPGSDSDLGKSHRVCEFCHSNRHLLSLHLLVDCLPEDAILTGYTVASKRIVTCGDGDQDGRLRVWVSASAMSVQSL